MTEEEKNPLEKPARDLLFQVRLMCVHFLATYQATDVPNASREELTQHYMNVVEGFSVVMPALVVASEALGLALDPPKGGLN